MARTITETDLRTQTGGLCSRASPLSLHIAPLSYTPCIACLAAGVQRATAERLKWYTHTIGEQAKGGGGSGDEAGSPRRTERSRRGGERNEGERTCAGQSQTIQVG